MDGQDEPAPAFIAAVASHLNVVQSILEMNEPSRRQPTRLGPEGQRPRRVLEQQVRGRVVAVARRMTELGHSMPAIAERLGLKERTLRHWQQVLRGHRLEVPAVGRPLLVSSPEQQQAAFSWLTAIGPGVGLPSLWAQFHTMARAELAEMLTCYRRWWRARHPRLLHVLHWQRPGSVWAMDFAHAPCAIDGRAPYLLAVRDLASGQQLLWLPVEAATAAVTLEALERLFTIHGAPWVLKTDNGSAFVAEEVRDYFRQWGVMALFSPPRMPTYNGAIEASIGSLKKRTEAQARQAGRPGAWTSADVEAAREEANTTSRPRRLEGATPEETWTARRPLSREERDLFGETVARLRVEARYEEGLPMAGALPRHEQAAVDRVALRRALVAHDLLLFTRRRIPPKIMRPKTAKKG